ncbi:hypothetical protein YC2023_032713 [Brassica napus]
MFGVENGVGLKMPKDSNGEYTIGNGDALISIFFSKFSYVTGTPLPCTATAVTLYTITATIFYIAIAVALTPPPSLQLFTFSVAAHCKSIVVSATSLSP